MYSLFVYSYLPEDTLYVYIYIYIYVSTGRVVLQDGCLCSQTSLSEHAMPKPCRSHVERFPRLGVPFEGAYLLDYRILGSLLGSRYSWKLRVVLRFEAAPPQTLRLLVVSSPQYSP